MLKAGDVVSYLEMCREEDVSLQRGMNFRLHNRESVILMSLRKDAPYSDRIEDNGRTLIYEGHDIPRHSRGPEPKTVDQPMCFPNGSLTQNGLFYEAANRFKRQETEAQLVKVYEKIRSGTWAYNGLFKLVDAWKEKTNGRHVFKFRLELIDEAPKHGTFELDHVRIIPASVKVEVWRRDKGRCVQCGSQQNLHFDHIIPYSKGGSSLVPENIQILCAKHNLAKRDNIE